MINFFRKRKLRFFFITTFLVVFGLLLVSHVPHASADPVPGAVVAGSAGAVDNWSIRTIWNYFTTGASATVDYAAGGIFKVIGYVLSVILYFILSMLAFVLSVVGGIFNWVFEYTVVGIKGSLENIKVISAGWTAVRDLANICFIFILLYLAIATILQLDEHGVKHSLSRLIIAAVLINFSLFFVKVIVDVPNILSIQIYNKVVTTQAPGQISSQTGQQTGLADIFFSLIAPQTAFGQNSSWANNPLTIVGTAATVVNGAVAASNTPTTTFVMGIIIMIIAIAVFAAVVVILIKRFVMIIFYMIFSPFAFAGMAIPIHSLQSMSKEKFWMGLIKEAFYMPIFMMCIYITVVTGYAIQQTTSQATASWSFLQQLNLGAANILSYLVVIVMLVASLFIAEMMGVKGASGAMSVYKGVTGAATGAARFTAGAAYNNTIGKVAETIRNKKYSDKLLTWTSGVDAKGKPVGFIKKWAARGAVATLNGASKGFRDKLTREEEYNAEAFEEVHGDPKVMAGKAAIAYASGKYSTANQALERNHHSWSSDQHADVKIELERMAKEDIKGAAEALNRLYKEHGYGRLDPEKADKVEQMIKNGRPAHLEAAKVADKKGGVAFNEFLNDENRTDGQRRFIAMRLKNGEMSTESVKSLMETIGKKDSSGMEAVIRDSMTSSEVRTAGQNVLMNARLRNNSVKVLSSGGPGASDPEMRKLAYKELFALEDIKKALGGISFDALDKKPGGFDELIKVYKASEHYAEDARGADTAVNQKRYVGPTSKTMQEEIELIEKYSDKKK